jgi:predicted ArsR family transcriptional regulator
MDSPIDRRILDYLLKQDWPVTTEMIAKELEISWNTAQVHLWRLVSESLVKGRRVGRQNQWIITDEGKKSQGRTSGKL